MRIAAESEFYIGHFGVDNGIKHLKNMGYQYLTYAITNRYDEPFTTLWTDQELEEYFAPIGESLKDNGMKMLFTTISTRIYSDVCLESNEARKKMVLHAMKATAYMGCEIIALCPISFYFSRDLEYSKRLTYEFYDEMMKEAERLGIQIAFVNNMNCYGSKTSELIELAEHYHADIVIDPSYAFYGGEKIEELLKGAGERIIGFLANDTGSDVGNTVIESRMPMMGALNYREMIEKLEKVNDKACVAMMYSSVFRRYTDFINNESLVCALEKVLFKMNRLMAGDLKRGGLND